MHEWGVDPDVLLSDTRILDVLLHNSDRHHGRLGQAASCRLGLHANGWVLGLLHTCWSTPAAQLPPLPRWVCGPAQVAG